MNARTATERQWAAACVRQPGLRHVLLKYLRAFGIDGYWVRLEDPQAALVYRAVLSLTMNRQMVTVQAVAEYMGERDFSMTVREAGLFLDGLLSALPMHLDAERLALALLAAMGITPPANEVADYLHDPYGRRAQLMLVKKVRGAR